MTESRFRDAALTQADWCRVLGAPFTAALCDALGRAADRSTAGGRRLLDGPGDPLVDALPLRAVGGINERVRAGVAPELAALFPPYGTGDVAALAAALPKILDDPRLLPWLDRPVQTNEIGRSAVLMAGLLALAAIHPRPMALHELGASAGLNLRLDRYSYRLGGLAIGTTDAAIRLVPAWDGDDPPAATVTVTSRRGVDLNPLDLLQPEARERLLAFVWPDHVERRQRLECAIEAFLADPVDIDRADAADWVETNVRLTPGTTTVVMNTIAFQYFPPSTQARISAYLDHLGAQATADAPLAWLNFEIKGAESGAAPSLRLKTWPGGADQLLAHAHPHGASVRWLG